MYSLGRAPGGWGTFLAEVHTFPPPWKKSGNQDEYQESDDVFLGSLLGDLHIGIPVALGIFCCRVVLARAPPIGSDVPCLGCCGLCCCWVSL